MAAANSFADLIASGETLPPFAPSMVEALRAVGYDLRTALADIVDNSITAHARHVWMSFNWDGSQSWISIRDDGDGMTPDRLFAAMRVGSQSPLEERAPNDLGRFGLGLKTASFSQCRRLTVRSRSDMGIAATASWDLDIIQRTGEWLLLHRPVDERSESRLGSPEDMTIGTIVLWETLDRMVTDPAHATSKGAFYRAIEEVDRHLAMVFHRYLANGLRIFMNAVEVKAWDPYMKGMSLEQPVEVVGNGRAAVTVAGYVLPHESKISSEQHGRAAGPTGWNAQQGYYIYRNRRLLLPGSWLGMFRQEEHYKLARIQIDLANHLDAAWHIDIRKATARPPTTIREPLQRYAQKVRTVAKRIYGHRGDRHVDQQHRNFQPVWLEQDAGHGQKVYRINRKHLLIEQLLTESAMERTDLNGALRLVEQTLPVNFITARFREGALNQGAPYEREPGDLQRTLRVAAMQLLGKGVAKEEARELLLRIEPFSHHRDIVMAIDLFED